MTALDRKLQRRYARIKKRREEKQRSKEIQELAYDTYTFELPDWMADIHSLDLGYSIHEDMRQRIDEARQYVFGIDKWRNDLDTVYSYTMRDTSSEQRSQYMDWKLSFLDGKFSQEYDSYDSGETIEAGDTSVMDEFLGEFASLSE